MKILNNILDAREKRYNLRKTYSDKNNSCLSLSFNIPGYPKSDSRINQLFFIVKKKLIRYLNAHRVFLEAKNERVLVDEAGDFFIAAIKESDLNIQKVKELCEAFEEQFDITRMIDIDITDHNFNNISSNKMKSCYICSDKSAVQCMRANTHTKGQLREYLFGKIALYLEENKKENIVFNLYSFALKAILYEVSLSPKPGTVDRFDSGIHTDMDFFTYINSSAAISFYFFRFIEAGYIFSKELEDALPTIRNIGLEMEEKMFAETGEVNTQKGIIFLFGISLFSMAYILKNEGYFKLNSFIDAVKKINKNISSNELIKHNQSKSHGEKCFFKFGKEMGGGIRSEVEKGFPTVVKYGLPVLKHGLSKTDGLYLESDIKMQLTDALVSIIANNNDTNILYRGGEEKLNAIKTLSAEYIKSDDKNKKKKYDLLIEYCNRYKVSPGGSSDLLAVSILLFFVEKMFKKLDY